LIGITGRSGLFGHLYFLTGVRLYAPASQKRDLKNWSHPTPSAAPGAFARISTAAFACLIIRKSIYVLRENPSTISRITGWMDFQFILTAVQMPEAKQF
jgi:hypothetical protein